MGAFLQIFPLFAQAAPATPNVWYAVLNWLITLGEPGLTIEGFPGAVLSWVKVVGLYCLMGWVLAWTYKAYKNQQIIGRTKILDYAALAAIGGLVCSVLLQIMQSTGRIGTKSVGGLPVVTLIVMISAIVILLWLERTVWSAVIRVGTKADLNTLGAMHLALAFGVVTSVFIRRDQIAHNLPGNWGQAIVNGVRYGGTYMGFVVFLRLLATLIPELFALRPRRLYSIAWLSVKEASRRMWAPYVVTVLFFLVLAFTSWFIQAPPRPAEFGRLYVITLTLVCSLLLTLMIAILTPLSIPADIQNQTIYTIVSKPVRRLEMVWGRLIGFMALVTVLVLVFTGVSLLYLYRTVKGEIDAVAAQGIGREGRPIRRRTDPPRARGSDAQQDVGAGSREGLADVPRFSRPDQADGRGHWQRARVPQLCGGRHQGGGDLGFRYRRTPCRQVSARDSATRRQPRPHANSRAFG